MKREACLSIRDKAIIEARRHYDLVQHIPENELLLLSIRCIVENKGRYGWKIIKAISKVITFNNSSIRFQIYAVDNKGAYPFNRQYKTDNGIHAIAFRHIKDYQVIPETDLPLCIGWPITYPCLAEALKGS